ncbi:MAG: manganese efflux pump [Acholeplasmatales bacterium]|nr:manganese efflux pump [Acholeplasmatales bacterium]
MTVAIILQILLLGVALSMDAFAVSITDGLVYTDINKKKSFFIAGLFGLMQALMPLIGFWLVEIITIIVGDTGGEKAGKIMSNIVSWTAFALLIFIGGKMIIEGIISLKKPQEEKEEKKFSYKEVIYFGFATAIDALGTGVALHSGLSNNYTIWLHVSIIMVITFIISLIGLFLGHQIEKLLKGKYEITSIIGGIILIALAVWIIVSHYAGI